MASKKYPREKRVDSGPRVEFGSLWLGPNARTVIEEAPLRQLTEQIRLGGGVREQLLVRRTDNPDNPDQHHQVWDGQRRFLAGQTLEEAGEPLQSVPARIMPAGTTDAEMMMLAAQTVTGIGKEPLTPLEEMRLITKLVGYGFTQRQVADRLGMDPSWVSKRAKLATTTPLVQAEVAENRMTLSKAQQLAGKPQAEQDQAAADSKAGRNSARKAAPTRPGKKAILAMLADALTAERTGAAMALRYAAGEMTAAQLRDALHLDAPPEVDPRQTTITDNPQPPARPAVPN
jgi:ParB-like chromosome segregation protein Spo0J